MLLFLKLSIIALTVFLVFDIIWLVFVAKNFYKNQIGFLMKEKINYLSAIIFYLIFIVSLVIFVIMPNIDENLVKLILKASLFGLVTYATYDLTNFSTLKGFKINVVLVDLSYGVIIANITAILTYLIYRGIFN
jgi:uncharacterized membrane protein